MLVPRTTHYYLAYQTQHIEFSEWINLLTLCLAPLVAHILVGAPAPIIMADTHPPWAERLSYYNPTSIVWRYFVITDRRVRTRDWGPDDMVAANSIFWTEAGWYNPASLRRLSEKDACSNLPRKGRISLLSASTLKTLLVAVQGVQALYSLVEYLVNGNYRLSLDTIFLPIAMLGLYRITAALWLFDDSGYFHNSAYALPSDRAEEDSLISEESGNPIIQPPRKRPRSHVFAVLVRAYFLIGLSGGLVLALLKFFRPYPGFQAPDGDTWWPATMLMTSVFFSFLVGVSAIIMFGYIMTGNTESAIIPCLGSAWYKLYTLILFSTALSLIVLSALETRKSPNGEYAIPLPQPSPPS